MYKFHKARWHDPDPDKIYNCTHRTKEKVLDTGIHTDYNAPTSHGISYSCCRRLVNESTTHPTSKLEESRPATTHQIDRRNF